MQSIYYSIASLLAIVIFCIINFNLLFEKDNKLEMNYYKRYLVSVLVFYIIDFSWGIIDFFRLIPLLYIDTFFYYVSMALSIVFWGEFASCFLNIEPVIAKLIRLVGRIFAIVIGILLIVNIFEPIFFMFDDRGVYHAGIFRYITFVLQILLFTNMAIQTLIRVLKTKDSERRRNIAIFGFSLSMILSLILQTFLPMLPIYSMGLIIGNCVSHVFIFEDDKSDQLKTIQLLNEELKESSLKQEEAFNIQKEYNDIISNAGLGIWHVTLEKNCKPKMQINPKMELLLGCKGLTLSEEEMYEYWFSKICDEDKESVKTNAVEMLNGRFSEHTYKWHHPKNGVVYFRCGGTAEKLGKRKVVLSGYSSEVTDIVVKEMEQKEELLAALKAADAASKAKTTFLNNMSHDIRTPMNAILGYTKLLSKKDNDAETTKDYLSKIESSGAYLLEIINNVLDVSRIDSGLVTVDESFTDLLDPVNNTLLILENEIKKRNLKFNQSCNITHRYVYADMKKVNQIVINIMSNAIKYTPEGGTITQLFEELPSEKEGYALYRNTISDNGIGMSEDFLKKIFDPFTRERNTTESKIIGTGLGMAIVKKLVDILGGKIEVKSKLGHGTTFIITVQHRIFENPEKYIDSQKKVSSETLSFKGKRILLAEDNELNAEIATELLTDAGFEIERAVDGVDCVDKLRNAKEGDFDLILMDIQMPRLDGYKATEIIRNSPTPWRRNIPIYAMTANAFEEDKQKALSVGMNGHIAKPIDVKKLFETLSEIFK